MPNNTPVLPPATKQQIAAAAHVGHRVVVGCADVRTEHNARLIATGQLTSWYSEALRLWTEDLFSVI